jgi:hypothetical protein
MGIRLNNFKRIAIGVWASPRNPMECGYFQTMRQKVLSLIDSPRKTRKEAKIAAA